MRFGQAPMRSRSCRSAINSTGRFATSRTARVLPARWGRGSLRSFTVAARKDGRGSLAIGARRAVAACLAATLIIGCQPTHQLKRQKAERDWRAMRAQVKHGLAEQQFRSGLTDDAIKSAKEAIGLDDSRVETYLLLVQAYLEKGDLSGARDSVDAAETLDTDHAEVAYTKGMVAERALQWDLAIQCYRQARTLGPGQRDYLIALVECLSNVGRYDEAYESLMAGMDEYPPDGTLETLWGRIALVQGHVGEAAVAFRKALDLVGDDPVLSEQYGLCLFRLKRYPEAAGVLSSLVDRSAGSGAGVVRALATCWMETRQSRSAIELIQNHLTLHPDDRTARQLLAESALQAGELRLAVRTCETILRSEPDAPRANLIYGYVSFKQGRRERARLALKKVVAHDGSNWIALCLLGDIYTETGNLSTAREYYLKALRVDPECIWAASALTAMAATAA